MYVLYTALSMHFVLSCIVNTVCLLGIHPSYAMISFCGRGYHSCPQKLQLSCLPAPLACCCPAHSQQRRFRDSYTRDQSSVMQFRLKCNADVSDLQYSLGALHCFYRRLRHSHWHHSCYAHFIAATAYTCIYNYSTPQNLQPMQEKI